MWNLGDILEGIQGAIAPTAPAFIHGDRTVPWSEAFARMRSLSAALTGDGGAPGDKVAFYMRNRPEFAELAGACFLGRLTHVNINYRYKPGEVRHILEDSDARIIVYDREFRATVAEVRGALPRLERCVEVGGGAGLPAFAEAYETLALREPTSSASPARSQDDQVLVYTGGTTGLPKGVVYRHGDLGPYLLASSGLFPAGTPDAIAGVADMIRARGGSGARYLPACPQMHATGFFVTLWTLLTGGCVVTVEGAAFDPHAVWRAAERNGVSHMAIVGDPFARPLLRALEEAPGRYDLGELAAIGSSGAMWSAEVKEGLLQHLPQAVLTDVFASTEAMGLGVSVTTKDSHTTTAAFVPGETVILIDDDDRPLAMAPGARGRLAVGGIQPLGYHKDPAKTAKTFRTIDGRRYSIPGDFAAVGADGRLILLGRGSGCINTAGEKVFPEEVEEALKTHASVDDALVVGVPDPAWGQAVTAVVALAPGSTFDEQALRRHAQASLARYKTPKRIFQTEGSLRAANGKADYPTALGLATRLIAEGGSAPASLILRT